MGIKDILLNEKVSKLDIEQALKNPNIRIGAEFEFRIQPFLEKYKKENEKFKRINDMEDEYNTYDDAFEEWADDPDNNEMPTLPKWAEEEGFTSGDDIPPPSELFPHLNIKPKNLWNKLIKEFLPVKKLPFSNYVIKYDHLYKSQSNWIIKPDGSLGLSGIEIVSPILTLDEFMRITPKVFEFIDNIKGSEVGEDCGFHIGVSLNNIPDLSKSLDITKLSVFMDEGYIYKYFKTREYNNYAKSAFDSIQRINIKETSPDLLKHLIDEKLLKRDYPSSHYMAINIEHLESANKYIEFRYLGATDYHRKWDRIKTIIAHYIYNLSISCDPTYKNKEYRLKLSRILNKIQLFTIVVKMNKMLKDIINMNDNEISKLSKEWKETWLVWNSLYLYKEAVDKDVEGTSARKAFGRLCLMLDVDYDNLIWDFKNYGPNYMSRYILRKNRR